MIPSIFPQPASRSGGSKPPRVACPSCAASIPESAISFTGPSPISTSLWPSITQDKELGKDLLELLHAGDLLLRDLRYFDTASFGNLVGRGIHWISRLPANVHASNDKGVSLKKILAKGKGSRIDLRMLITAKRYRVRMVTKLAYALVDRTNEFDGQDESQVFGTVSLNRTFW